MEDGKACSLCTYIIHGLQEQAALRCTPVINTNADSMPTRYGAKRHIACESRPSHLHIRLLLLLRQSTQIQLTFLTRPKKNFCIVPCIFFHASNMGCTSPLITCHVLEQSSLLSSPASHTQTRASVPMHSQPQHNVLINSSSSTTTPKR